MNKKTPEKTGAAGRQDKSSVKRRSARTRGKNKRALRSPAGHQNDGADPKTTEESLLDSDGRIQSIVECISLGIHMYRLEPDGRLVFIGANPAADRILGVDNRMFIGKTIEEAFPPLKDSDVPEQYREVARSGKAWQTENIEYEDNAIKGAFEVHAFRIGPNSMVATFEDITRRKQAEQDLREKENKYRTLFEAANDGIFILDSAGFRDCNQRGAEMYGLPKEKIIGSSPADFAPVRQPDGRLSAEVTDEKVRAALNGNPQVFEWQPRRADGGLFDVEVTLSRLDLGGAICLQAIVRDITGKKRAEELLQMSEERFRCLVEDSPLAISIINKTGRIEYANNKHAEIVGYTAEELPTVDSWWAAVYPDEEIRQHIMAAWRDLSRKILNGEDVEPIERTIVRKDGSRRDVEIHFSLTGENILAFFVDITERKSAGEALRESQERLDLALQSAHMGVWRWEIRENRRYFDDLTCQLLGIESATFTGTAEEFFQAVHPEDRDKVKAALSRTIEQDLLYEPSYRVVWPEGSIHYISARGKLVRDDKGQPARINGILWDITDQRLFEQERIKAQKLESIGTLAGGIAHDFNNLLQGIFGYISMAKLTIDQREKSLAMLEQAEGALHQSVNLTSQLLTFSKGGKPVKKLADLRPAIENAAKFALSGSHVTADISFAADLRTVEADEGQIGQVVQNIVLNADQSMPLGGRIEIAVRNTDASEVAGLPHDFQGALVEITVSDHGTGIPPEHLSRIFDPYFTTKEKGSGLGLATSYSIIRNHGGVIMVSSELGKGSTFRIYLPASGASVEKVHTSKGHAAVRKGRVLIMDDEKVVRDVTGALISLLGHEVAFAEHGESAIAQYCEAIDTGKPFDVVLLDLTVRGGMGGLEAMQKLLEIDPGVTTVVSSGYSDDASMSDCRSKGFRAFLKKPYTLSDLRSTLDAVMAWEESRISERKESEEEGQRKGSGRE